MAKVCDILGKQTIFGNNVSHANNKTRRKFLPNLQKKKFFVSDKNIWINIKVSTKAIRIINKDGFIDTIKKYKKKGTLNKNLSTLVI